MEKDYITTLDAYHDSLVGGLNNIEEIEVEIDEMRNAKIGTIKPNCWQKVSDNEFLIYVL